jgi:hypothetical protein
MKEKKITAVEWFLNELLESKIIATDNYDVYMFRKAKEMEKEQIIEARIDGHNAPSSTLKHYDAAQYYNETFKQQEQ